MAQNVGKRGQTKSVQGPDPNSGEPWVSSQYSWHSFPQPSDYSDNTVITVHSASFNKGPPIPLGPVQANKEGEQSASTESAGPWQLVKCWVPKPEPEPEVLVNHWASGDKSKSCMLMRKSSHLCLLYQPLTEGLPGDVQPLVGLCKIISPPQSLQFHKYQSKW